MSNKNYLFRVQNETSRQGKCYKTVNICGWRLRFRNKNKEKERYHKNVLSDTKLTLEHICDQFALLREQLTICQERLAKLEGRSADNIVRISQNFGYYLTAYSLHQKVFPKYKGMHSGNDIVIVATGPSLKSYIPLSNAIHIGVNKAFKYDKVRFDYLFVQDYAYPTCDYIDDFIKYDSIKTKKFMGYESYSDRPLQCYIPDKFCIGTDIERYYVAHPNVKNTFTYDISCEPLGDSESIVFPVMQFALYTNPRKIYLVGCDTNTSGYYDQSHNNLNVDAVLNGWKKLKVFAETCYPDTEIISINPVGLKGLFKDVYQTTSDTISIDYYSAMYKEIHDDDVSYGSTSIDFLETAQVLIDYLKPKSILDYGCGKGTLLRKLEELYPNINFYGYDPSIPGREEIPVKHVDLIINTDVLEHIPEDIIPNVLAKMAELSDNVFFALHHALASAILPNGENAHITVKPREWYGELLSKYFKTVNQYDGKYNYTSFALTFDMPDDVRDAFVEAVKG